MARRVCAVLAGVLALCSPGRSVAEPDPAPVELIPAEHARLGFKSLLIGFTSLLGGWRYWHGERHFEVHSVPEGAELSLYYIRSNFQQRYEQADAPVRVEVPSRANITKRDAIRVRAFAPGYAAKEVAFKANKVPERVVITLDPLPNALVYLGHTTLGGRTTLVMRTKEEPEVRVGGKGKGDLTIALTRTANRLEASPRIASGRVRSVSVSQVGEDCMLRVDTGAEPVEVRSRLGFDPIHQEHLLVLDLVAKGELPPTLESITEEFTRLAFQPGDRCHAAFEASLRESLGAERISRAVRAGGGLAEAYRRQAMLVLGRTDQGRVRVRGGELLRTGSPLELEMALQGAAEVEGYLALLGAFARAQTDPVDTFRSLVSPESGLEEFTPIHERAEARFRECTREPHLQ